MITVISHIYNEEYLLPFWLDYHSKIFDNGIIIDYMSTDNSSEIIKSYCPSWNIIKTRNINANGTPNFEAHLIDLEVMDIEKTIQGHKICLNVTEFIVIKNKDEFLRSLVSNTCYPVYTYNAGCHKKKFFPKNTLEFFSNISLCIDYNRGFRYLHSEPSLLYTCGRHSYTKPEINEEKRDDVFLIRVTDYPSNNQMLKRRLQIQNNIPECDRKMGKGVQHIGDKNYMKSLHTSALEKMTPIHNFSRVCELLNININRIKHTNTVYYNELLPQVNWGENRVIITEDTNLLDKTDFNISGFKIFDMDNYNDLLRRFISNEIFFITGRHITLENYHCQISEDEHKKIINSMPYKRNMYSDVNDFSDYIEKFVSESVGYDVKIFNNDLWFRICRPDSFSDTDFNPCHRDIYLDFYRNVVNIYLPVAGSNENSALMLQPESHLWNESETMVTKGGASFKYSDKKYSVDAVVASKSPLNLIRPNPTTQQVMIFSPYLIHGCSNNSNPNSTRFSLEVRFIKRDEIGIKQETEFNNFLVSRTWR
jgi:hypothetical protein